MEYEILSINDDNTALVRMQIGDHCLNQNFPLGTTPDDLKDAILVGMAQFNASVAQPDSTTVDSGFQDLIGSKQAVKPADLPDLPEPEETPLSDETPSDGAEQPAGS